MKQKSNYRLLILLVTLLLIPCVAAALPAFPGAEGFGAQSVGGRGGAVIEVTNLNDSGAGSLRAAIDATGPRTVVFRIGGTIELQSPLKIRNPYITIAGQTSPGGGITLKNAAAMEASMIVNTHDVIIRYIRVRPGAGGDSDGLAIEYYNSIYPYNVIVDHCSLSWAVDGNLDIYGYNITAQNNIIAEGLNNSTHSKGAHSTGMLVKGNGTYNITLYRNLYAHNSERNPRVLTNGTVDIVNNVIYNPKFYGSWGPSHVSTEHGTPKVNYVKNYYKAGINSGSADYYISGAGQIYLQGNITPARTSNSQAETDGVIRSSNISQVVSSRHAAPAMPTLTAFEAYNSVLSDVGANAGLDSLGYRFSRIDPVDLRLINDVFNGTGKIIDDPSQIGGWPSLSRGTAPVDYDRDGMPDDWEMLNNLNPNDPADRNLKAADGYTYLEKYLNSIVAESGENPSGGSPPPAPGSFEFAADNYAVREDAGAVNLTIKRAGGSDGAVSVNYGTKQGTATVDADYIGVKWTTLSFADGETIKVVSINIIDDTLVEGDETFTVLLDAPGAGATVGAIAASVVTINDNDQFADTSKPLKVKITSHQDGATVSSRSEETIVVESDSTGVTMVQFFVDGLLLGQAKSAPFKANWTVPNKPNQRYAIEVWAYDDANKASMDSIALYSASNNSNKK